ncbi:LiaF transmembrane domain-containing protein [Streptococcus massiliensis]|uniref:Uncharacterized conserved secreted protein n=1 Tax=Streptococcus massiliensis TaxID=313439 RepID=A0A380KYA0_9STRE|nr:hypothetical protein [Streptococcus massiliensis]SUN76531.1 putative uncharacterized conserved secreted protein [Streptococcus massiliensis]
MKKYILGIGFLLLAGWVLLQGNFGIPPINVNIWPMLGIAFFVYWGLQKLVEGEFISGAVFALIALVIANSVYDLLPIGNGPLILGVILALVGLNILFKPRKKWKKYIKLYKHGKSHNLSETAESIEMSFGSSTKYINSDNFTYGSAEIAFGNCTIYFDNATILGESAQFDVEVAFGEMKIYVPKEWEVITEIDRVFSGVDHSKNVNAKDKKLYLTGDVAFGSLKIFYL